MPKPLRSEDPRPRDIQFKHFGVLNSGAQSKTSLFTSITVNVVIGLICVIIGAATKKIVDTRPKEVTYIVPLKEKPPPPPPVKMPPPPKLPPPPKIDPPKIEPPKIKLPDVPVPEPPKPMMVPAPKPAPVVTLAQPKIQVAAAAPKVVSVNIAKSASVVNNDPHPTAVALGHPDSPVPFQKTGPAVATVNMNRGMSGMPPENSGGGPRSTVVNMGSGQPGGKIGGGSTVAVSGVKLGCVGCTGTTPGNGTGNSPRQVQMATLGTPPPPPAGPAAIKSPVAHTPQVLYKPKPAYTAEATSMHIEGTVTVKIHVSAGGAVTVVGVVAGLGHGLDQSAVAAAQAIRFKPATDAAGNSVDWEGPVNIIFQIAS